ncbi:MAG: PspC domain-containing protein [Patescibacteria group bacterium]|nr:PspC domain-containing protein [Patescibacteria group bacterium]
MKKLYRNSENKIFAGVIGGLGEYFNIDPVLLRILWIFTVFFTGFMPGIIVYLIAVFVVPSKPKK